MNQELIEIRCPLTREDKYGLTHICSRLAGRVKPGSAGELYCEKCKHNFEFEVAKQDEFDFFASVANANNKGTM